MSMLTKDDVRVIVKKELHQLIKNVAILEMDVAEVKAGVKEIKEDVGTILMNVDRLLMNTETETQERKIANAQIERRVEVLEKTIVKR